MPIKHICVQDDRSVDAGQNALKVEGANHNLLRTEVIREESQFATIWHENCHRHSAIHPHLCPVNSIYPRALIYANFLDVSVK